MFAQTLTITPHLFSNGLFGMVYEHLLKCFIPEDPSSQFSEFFQATTTVARGDILRSMALMLKVNRLLAMAKDINGLLFIIVGEVFLRFINHFIIF
jgi:hypothetical protein